MIELVCIAIVLAYVVVRARIDAAPRAFLLRLASLAVASWVAEDSVIRAYGFYSYAPTWHVFVDRVPIMIVLIWPVVIHSAHELAKKLSVKHVALTGAAIVLADASLIEPVAVRAGLWSWTEPGLFDVPPIGILGWAFFAGLTMRVPLAVAVLGTHALLVGAWWILFRWINAPIPSAPIVAIAWIASIALAIHTYKTRVREKIPLVEMLLRVPGALFFFALLAIGRASPPLIAYALAFAPPYLAITNVKKY